MSPVFFYLFSFFFLLIRGCGQPLLPTWGQGSPAGCLWMRSGWLAGIRRLLPRAKLISARCGWEQGTVRNGIISRWDQGTAGIRMEGPKGPPIENSSNILLDDWFPCTMYCVGRRGHDKTIQGSIISFHTYVGQSNRYTYLESSTTNSSFAPQLCKRSCSEIRFPGQKKLIKTSIELSFK